MTIHVTFMNNHLSINAQKLSLKKKVTFGKITKVIITYFNTFVNRLLLCSAKVSKKPPKKGAFPSKL